MDDIAKEAGFTKPILYQYFDSKTDLYREIVAQTAEKLLASSARRPSSACRVAARQDRGRLSRLLRDGRERDRRLPDPLHPLPRGRDRGTSCATSRLGLISFLEPYINISISDDHRRQLAAGVVGIAEGAAVAWLDPAGAEGLAVALAERGRAAGRAQRHARLGRAARGPAGLAERFVGHQQREDLGELP